MKCVQEHSSRPVKLHNDMREAHRRPNQVRAQLEQQRTASGAQIRGLQEKLRRGPPLHANRLVVEMVPLLAGSLCSSRVQKPQ